MSGSGGLPDDPESLKRLVAELQRARDELEAVGLGDSAPSASSLTACRRTSRRRSTARIGQRRRCAPRPAHAFAEPLTRVFWQLHKLREAAGEDADERLQVCGRAACAGAAHPRCAALSNNSFGWKTSSTKSAPTASGSRRK